MTPQYLNYQWINLNDGNTETCCITTNTANAYMELDFGVEGRKTARVRVVHCKQEMGRANGVTLYVMDVTRNIILEYTFNGITPTSEISKWFDIPPPPDVGQGQLIRYLRLQRTIGRDYMYESALEAYLRSHTHPSFDHKHGYVNENGMPWMAL